MTTLVQKLQEKKLVNPPSWLIHNIHYLGISGSHAYGCADTSVKKEMPDYDYYGVCIPPKDYVFPHLRGEIAEFGTPGPRFEQWQQIGIQDPDKKCKYDFQVYNIIKYFELCRNCNPNMIDSLYIPTEYITHITKIGHIIRDNRQLFLSKLAYHRFRGYAFSQLKKAQNKNPIGKRKEIVDKWGVDIKFLYHIVRLLDECEQILEQHMIDLQRQKELFKSIRRGEWTYKQIEMWMKEKEKTLENIYNKSTLPYSADEEKLKEVLLNCLEEHYGNLTNIINNNNWERYVLQDIDALLNKHRKKLY